MLQTSPLYLGKIIQTLNNRYGNALCHLFFSASLTPFVLSLSYLTSAASAHLFSPSPSSPLSTTSQSTHTICHALEITCTHARTQTNVALALYSPSDRVSQPPSLCPFTLTALCLKTNKPVENSAVDRKQHRGLCLLPLCLFCQTAVAVSRVLTLPPSG